MERKYPAKLFYWGTLLNFLFRNMYLFVPGIVFCLVGIWVKSCLWIGLCLLGLDLFLSVLLQVKVRKIALTRSNNPEINQLMEALTGPGGLDDFHKIIDEKIKNSSSVDVPDEDV